MSVRPMQGGVEKADLSSPNVDAVKSGAENLVRHIENIRKFGANPVIAIHHFVADDDQEVAALRQICEEQGVRFAHSVLPFACGVFGSEPPSDPNEFIQTLEQFRPTSTPVSISGDLAAELQDILLDSSTYYWEAAKACDPNFGVRIHYQNGDDEFDILLCFQCDILAVYKNGKAVGGEDFDSARSRLVKIVQELFPDDDTIQSLN